MPEHSDVPDPAAVVRAFHEAMQARDWEAAATWLAPAITVWWPATAERFNGERFLAMQRAYPEGWRIEVVELMADGTQAAGRIAVDHEGQRYWNLTRSLFLSVKPTVDCSTIELNAPLGQLCDKV